jgi:uncharacterized protein YdeI (YjbR/CyaY-like superfamily)
VASVNVSERRYRGETSGVCYRNCELAFDHFGQIHKGVWGMSWRQKAMKGVEGCEKPGEAVKQALIPGYPNYCMLNT